MNQNSHIIIGEMMKEQQEQKSEGRKRRSNRLQREPQSEMDENITNLSIHSKSFQSQQIMSKKQLDAENEKIQANNQAGPKWIKGGTKQPQNNLTVNTDDPRLQQFQNQYNKSMEGNNKRQSQIQSSKDVIQDVKQIEKWLEQKTPVVLREKSLSLEREPKQVDESQEEKKNSTIEILSSRRRKWNNRNQSIQIIQPITLQDQSQPNTQRQRRKENLPEFKLKRPKANADDTEEEIPQYRQKRKESVPQFKLRKKVEKTAEEEELTLGRNRERLKSALPDLSHLKFKKLSMNSQKGDGDVTTEGSNTRKKIYSKQSVPNVESLGLKPIKAKVVQVNLKNLSAAPPKVEDTTKCFVNYDKFDRKSLQPEPIAKKDTKRKKSASGTRQKTQDASFNDTGLNFKQLQVGHPIKLNTEIPTEVVDLNKSEQIVNIQIGEEDIRQQARSSWNTQGADERKKKYHKVRYKSPEIFKNKLAKNKSIEKRRQRSNDPIKIQLEDNGEIIEIQKESFVRAQSPNVRDLKSKYEKNKVARVIPANRYNEKYSLGEKLPAHVGERTEILLRNLPHQDLVNIQHHNVPAFLRVDKDVKAQQQILNELKSQYMEKDLNELYQSYKDKLNNDLKESSEAFQNNRATTLEAIQENEVKLQQCEIANNTNIKNMAVITNDQVLSQTGKTTKHEPSVVSQSLNEKTNYLNHCNQSEAKKNELREKMFELEALKRELEISNTISELENSSLKNVLTAEKKLRLNAARQLGSILSREELAKTEGLNEAKVIQNELNSQNIHINTKIGWITNLGELNITVANSDDKGQDKKALVVTHQDRVKHLNRIDHASDQNIEYNRKRIQQLSNLVTEAQKNQVDIREIEIPSRQEVDKLQREYEQSVLNHQNLVDTAMDQYEQQKDKQLMLSFELEEKHKELFKVKTQIEVLDAKIEHSSQVHNFYANCGQNEYIASLKEKIHKTEITVTGLNRYLQSNHNEFEVKFQDAKQKLEKQVDETMKHSLSEQLAAIQRQSMKYEVEIINESHRNALRAKGLPVEEVKNDMFNKYTKKNQMYRRFQERSGQRQREDSQNKLREKITGLKSNDNDISNIGFKERVPIDMRLDTTVNIDKAAEKTKQKKRDDKRARLKQKRLSQVSGQDAPGNILTQEQLDERRNPIYEKDDDRDQLLFGRNFSYYELHFMINLLFDQNRQIHDNSIMMTELNHSLDIMECQAAFLESKIQEMKMYLQQCTNEVEFLQMEVEFVEEEVAQYSKWDKDVGERLEYRQQQLEDRNNKIKAIQTLLGLSDAEIQELEEPIEHKEKNFPAVYEGGIFNNATYARLASKFEYKADGNITQQYVDDILDPSRYTNAYAGEFESDNYSDKTEEEVPEIKSKLKSRHYMQTTKAFEYSKTDPANPKYKETAPAGLVFGPGFGVDADQEQNPGCDHHVEDTEAKTAIQDWINKQNELIPKAEKFEKLLASKGIDTLQIDQEKLNKFICHQACEEIEKGSERSKMEAKDFGGAEETKIKSQITAITAVKQGLVNEQDDSNQDYQLPQKRWKIKNNSISNMGQLQFQGKSSRTPRSGASFNFEISSKEDNGADTTRSGHGHQRGGRNMQVAMDLMVTGGQLNKDTYQGCRETAFAKEHKSIDLGQNKKQFDRYTETAPGFNF